MAQSKLIYSAATSLDVTAAATLANATSANSAAINNTANGYFDYDIAVTVTTGGSAALGSVLEIYVKGSVDGTNYEDDGNDHWAGTITLAAAGAQTDRTIISAAAAFSGPLPPYIIVRLRNATGAALTAASASWVGILTQTV